MKTIQFAFPAVTLATLIFTSSGCLVGPEHHHSRVVVSEPAGVEVHRYDHRYPSRTYHQDYDRRDGYYDSRGFWHPYSYRRY